MTGTGTTGTINGEVNLQFNGTTLELTGAYRLKHDLSYLVSSGMGYGDILKIGTGTLATGSVYYLSSTQAWTPTNSGATASSDGLIGIALGISATADGVLIRGYAKNSSWTFATGSKLYLGPTASTITSTAPSATGSVIRIIGYQIENSTNKIYFNPSNEWLEN